MPNIWTINSATGRDGVGLVGNKIIVSEDGKHYQFCGPSPRDILSTTPGDQLPTPPFDFPQFRWAPPGDAQLTWSIHVWTLTGGPGRNQAQGTWVTSDSIPDPAQDDSGTFTAQAGATLEEESEGDAAAAAGGGSNV